MNSGQRWMTRTNEKPRCRYAACDDVVEHLRDPVDRLGDERGTFCTPSVTLSGLRGSRYDPRGVVLLLRPFGDVGDACFLVSPYTKLSCRSTVRFML